MQLRKPGLPPVPAVWERRGCPSPEHPPRSRPTRHEQDQSGGRVVGSDLPVERLIHPGGRLQKSCRGPKDLCSGRHKLLVFVLARAPPVAFARGS